MAKVAKVAKVAKAAKMAIVLFCCTQLYQVKLMVFLAISLKKYIIFIATFVVTEKHNNNYCWRIAAVIIIKTVPSDPRLKWIILD